MMTCDRLHQLVTYDHNTGDFTWKERKLRIGIEKTDKGWNTRLAGKAVAKRPSRRCGHYRISFSIDGEEHYAHRLVWLYVYGEWPSGNIDHISGDPSDNRIANLRLATPSQNMMNQKVRSDNSSGTRGVSFDRRLKKWFSYINIDYKRIPLGMFSEIGAAIKAREDAENRYYGEFMRR